MVDEEAVPEALVEVPTEAWEAVEEAEFEEVAVGEVGEGADAGREVLVTDITKLPSENIGQT